MGSSLCAQMSGAVTGKLALEEGTKKMGKGSPCVWKLVIVVELRIKYPKNQNWNMSICLYQKSPMLKAAYKANRNQRTS